MPHFKFDVQKRKHEISRYYQAVNSLTYLRELLLNMWDRAAEAAIFVPTKQVASNS